MCYRIVDVLVAVTTNNRQGRRDIACSHHFGRLHSGCLGWYGLRLNFSGLISFRGPGEIAELIEVVLRRRQGVDHLGLQDFTQLLQHFRARSFRNPAANWCRDDEYHLPTP